MAQITVQGKVLGPSGAPVGGGALRLRLSPPILAGFETAIAADGSVSFSITPNDQITPAGTRWYVEFFPAGQAGFRWREAWLVASTPDPVDIGDIPRE